MATDGGEKRGWPWWWCSLVVLLPLLLSSLSLAFGSEVALTGLADGDSWNSNEEVTPRTNVGYVVVLAKLFRSLSEPGEPSNARVWPELEFGLRVVLGSIIGFLGAALGSIGGVGGGGIFVPMLTLIIGFDPKTSTAMSKCMIMGAAGSTVYYNRRLRHPTLDLPIIDYDLALLFQPMLMLGISIGVAFNVMFPEWMVTVLLIVLFLGTSTKALFKGIETWKKESIMKMEAAAKLMASSTSTMNEGPEMEYKAIQGGPTINMQSNSPSDEASIGQG
ncbi:uncharacterized protein M6B38_330370 [Iris pallida]|uniref:Sulfite exporter TauE/SafE family protein n=1 Tax=Iris pallida TaxID=29817 RepID=A0AAX6H548_IRIPA|nr:uncharacterized protein M6B38_330370 [Iris pallida]